MSDVCEVCGLEVRPYADEWTLACTPADRASHWRLGYERATATAEKWALREAALVEAGIRREAEWLNEQQELTRRADRYEAEFSACKALLIAEQKRAERAEAERAAATAEFVDAAKAAVPESEHPRDPADWPWSIRLLGDDRRACYRQRDEAQRDLRDFKRDCDRMLDDAYQGGKRAEAGARALALREAAERAEAKAEWLKHNAHYDGLGMGWQIGEALALQIGKDIRALAALPVEPARRQVTEITQKAGTPRAPEPCQYCGCTDTDSPHQRAAKLHGASISAAHLALGDPAQGVSVLARMARGATEPAPQNPPPSPTGDAE
jgi:hypothetical protein